MLLTDKQKAKYLAYLEGKKKNIPSNIDSENLVKYTEPSEWCIEEVLIRKPELNNYKDFFGKLFGVSMIDSFLSYCESNSIKLNLEFGTNETESFWDEVSKVFNEYPESALYYNAGVISAYRTICDDFNIEFNSYIFDILETNILHIQNYTTNLFKL